MNEPGFRLECLSLLAIHQNPTSLSRSGIEGTRIDFLRGLNLISLILIPIDAWQERMKARARRERKRERRREQKREQEREAVE